MRAVRSDKGFTMVELMVVVLIIGILVAIAIPVFNTSQDKAEQRTCFANQRIVESSAQAFSADNEADMSSLAGVVTGTHSLIDDYIFREPPRCPSAPEPADPMTTDVAHGAYTLDGNGTVSACTHGTVAHGAYR